MHLFFCKDYDRVVCLIATKDALAIEKAWFLFVVTENNKPYIAGMEKVTFVFLNEQDLQQFISRTTVGILKPDVTYLSVTCHCNGKECSNGIIDAAQTDYGAMIFTEDNF